MRTFFAPPAALLRLAACLLLVPFSAVAQIAVAPAAPQMLDPVRVLIPRAGTFVFNPGSVRVSLTDGKFTVLLKFGAALDPPPPPSTFEVLLGQLPMGTYQVEVILDNPIPSSLGSTSFTVGPRTSPLATYSDLWWDPDESGWGINIIEHPTGMIFATLFFYQTDASGAGPPRWYVVPTGTWSSSNVFTGPLYRTTGPQVGATFDPSRVTRTPAGSVAITFLSKDTAQLAVTSAGVTVTKPLRRQPF